MKKCIGLLAFVISCLLSKGADSAYTITGKLDQVKSGTILVNIYGDNEQKLTAKIINGTFTLNGFIQKPTFAYLTLKDKEQDYVKFYIEPGNIIITGKGSSIKDVIVSNSPLNDDDKLLKQQMQDVTKWEDINSKLYDEASNIKNKSVLDSLDEVDFDVLSAKRKIVAAFVKEHPNSLRSAMAISENYGYYAEADEVEPLYNLLSNGIKNSGTGNDIKKLIDVYRTVAVGNLAPDIKQNTPQGTPLSLSSLKGKYVLVDFWASWCPPCRRENPNIVKLYNEYNNKGFDVFAVSYDVKKEKWEKAIKDDSLTWNQVSDLQGWKNATSDIYGIKAIPSNLLLDKEG